MSNELTLEIQQAIREEVRDYLMVLRIDVQSAFRQALTALERSDIYCAKRRVWLWAGEINCDVETADEIYEIVLQALGVDISNIKPSEYWATLLKQPIPGMKVKVGEES